MPGLLLDLGFCLSSILLYEAVTHLSSLFLLTSYVLSVIKLSRLPSSMTCWPLKSFYCTISFNYAAIIGSFCTSS